MSLKPPVKKIEGEERETSYETRVHELHEKNTFDKELVQLYM